MTTKFYKPFDYALLGKRDQDKYRSQFQIDRVVLPSLQVEYNTVSLVTTPLQWPRAQAFCSEVHISLLNLPVEQSSRHVRLIGTVADLRSMFYFEGALMTDFEPMNLTGSRGPYRWFVTKHDDLPTLIESCPQFLAGRYIAVTSVDSGPKVLTDEEKSLGWHSRNDIAYSPQVPWSVDGHLEGAWAGQCEGYDEWYVFESTHDLGTLCHGNVFESDLAAGKIWSFVNYADGFALYNPEMSDLTNLFWKQLEWIHPESFVADGGTFMTFVSRNESIFDAACNALQGLGGGS